MQDELLLQQEPTFNLGISTINRINERFIGYAIAYASQDWETAFTQLDLVSQEIDCFLKSDEHTAGEKIYNSIQKELSGVQQQMQQAPHSKSVTVQSNLPKQIREWSLLLRTFAYKHKLYMPTSQDVRFLSARN